MPAGLALVVWLVPGVDSFGKLLHGSRQRSDRGRESISEIVLLGRPYLHLLAEVTLQARPRAHPISELSLPPDQLHDRADAELGEAHHRLEGFAGGIELRADPQEGIA